MVSLPRSARLLRTLTLGACLFPLVQACGRSEPGDYLFDADGIDTGGTTSTTAGRNPVGTAGTQPSNGASSAVGGRPTTGGVGPIAFGGNVSVGGRPTMQGGEGGVSGAPIAGSSVGGAVVAGAGGVPPVPPISCGNQACDPDTEICCAGFAGLNCISDNQECIGAVLGCTLNEDCANGNVCCLAITGDSSAASSCKDRCDNMGTDRERQLCQSDDDCQAPFRFCTPTIFGVNICTRRP
jgi:hypothetical protein